MNTVSLDVISELKNQRPTFNEPFGLHVSSTLRLAPVGHWVLAEEKLVQDLVSWRSKNSSYFFAQVPATQASMRTYLVEYAIRDPRRILFIIYYEGAWSGHIGLARVSRTSAELDNVIRGRKTYKGMMLDVVNFLKDWALHELGITSLYLRVRSDNKAAIDLYSRSGFKELNQGAREDFAHIDKLQLAESGGVLMSVQMEQAPRTNGRNRRC